MGQNGSKWPELHWPNPGDLFFPSIRSDGTLFQIRAPHGGVWSALGRGVWSENPLHMFDYG